MTRASHRRGLRTSQPQTGPAGQPARGPGPTGRAGRAGTGADCPAVQRLLFGGRTALLPRPPPVLERLPHTWARFRSAADTPLIIFLIEAFDLFLTLKQFA